VGLPIENHVFLLRYEGLIPLAQLFGINTESSVYNEGIRQGIFYAESWALHYYVMLGRPELCEKLNLRLKLS
jgi:hypothetical protein